MGFYEAFTDAGNGNHGYNTRRTNAEVRRRVLSAVGDSRERTADGEPIPLFMSNVYNIVDGRGNGIVGWGEDGDTFIVHDAQAFSREILPQHFRHSNFSSFVRQLNFYGFRSSSRRDDADPRKRTWEFRHPMFRRGGRDALSKIRRKTYSESANAAARGDLADLREEVFEIETGIDQLRQTVDLLMRSTALLVDTRKRARPASPADAPPQEQAAGAGQAPPPAPVAPAGGSSDVPPPKVPRRALSPQSGEAVPFFPAAGDTDAGARLQGPSPMQVGDLGLAGGVAAAVPSFAHGSLGDMPRRRVSDCSSGSRQSDPVLRVAGPPQPVVAEWDAPGVLGSLGLGDADFELTAADFEWLDAQARGDGGS